MKKTIIAIWGTASQGKTTTIKEVSKLIEQKFKNVITDPSPINYEGEIYVVITIGNIKIGITSQGDPNTGLPSRLEELAKKGCDIIICATRTGGNTVASVNIMKPNHNYDIIWATPYVSYEKDKGTLNKLAAEHIAKLIDEILLDRI